MIKDKLIKNLLDNKHSVKQIGGNINIEKIILIGKKIKEYHDILLQEYLEIKEELKESKEKLQKLTSLRTFYYKKISFYKEKISNLEETENRIQKISSKIKEEQTVIERLNESVNKLTTDIGIIKQANEKIKQEINYKKNYKLILQEIKESKISIKLTEGSKLKWDLNEYDIDEVIFEKKYGINIKKTNL